MRSPFCLILLACILSLKCLVWPAIAGRRVISGLLMLEHFVLGIVYRTALITFERIRY